MCVCVCVTERQATRADGERRRWRSLVAEVCASRSGRNATETAPAQREEHTLMGTETKLIPHSSARNVAPDCPHQIKTITPPPCQIPQELGVETSQTCRSPPGGEVT